MKQPSSSPPIARARPCYGVWFAVSSLVAATAHAGNTLPMPAPDAAPATRMAAIDAIELHIRRIEADAGPYHPQLSEHLSSLGLAYMNDGVFDKAGEAFRRAMHIERVNGGLYSTSQVPILQLVIDSDADASDWAQVDKDFQYYEWLHQRAYGDDDLRTIDALDTIINWHLAAIHLDAEGNQGYHLLRLVDLAQRKIEALAKIHGVGSPVLLEHLYRQALHYYYVAIAVQRGGSTGECLIRELSSPLVYEKSLLEARDEVVSDSYKKGRMLLKRIAEIVRDSPELPAEAEAVMLTYFADWELLFGHRRPAEKAYLTAYQGLVHAEVSAADISRYFGAPVVLPIQEFRLRLPENDWSRPSDAPDQPPDPT